jgi:PhoH-like ATPase
VARHEKESGKEPMKKNYILDTNVLLHDPNAIHKFEENNIIIPIRVIEEIDHFKRELSELGRSARQISRMLDELRSHGKLSDGVKLDNGGELRIMFNGELEGHGGAGPADFQILQMAILLRKRNPEIPCIVVSKDVNLRLKADAMGLDAENYEHDHVDIDELYTGHSELEVSPEALKEFMEKGRIPAGDPVRSPNEYVVLKVAGDPSHSGLGRYDGEQKAIVALIRSPEEMRQVYPKNKEQFFAVDALLDDRIKIVTIIGKAGTGKTLLAIAAGLHKTLWDKVYRKMLVCRPTFPMGKDIGYLPGTVEEKLNPWMQPIYDALDLLSNGRKDHSQRNREALEEADRIGVEPLTYIRGRSIPNQYIVVDEAQNLTPLEVKTVITRVGHGTKIILTGDIYQIDNPYVDAMSNGLSVVVDRFRQFSLAAHVHLSKGVRSEVAELAANLL